MTPTVFTFGHGTAGAAEITALLRGVEVQRLVDVRSVPGSRHNPESAREAMAHWLPEAGIAYQWEPRLGGWRRAKGDPVDVSLRVESFRSYAVYMRTPEFRSAVDELLVIAAEQQIAIMCAETVWWRCHRKLISDYLTLVRGVAVRHLMHDGKLRAHRPTAEARVDHGLLNDGLLNDGLLNDGLLNDGLLNDDLLNDDLLNYDVLIYDGPSPGEN